MDGASESAKFFSELVSKLSSYFFSLAAADLVMLTSLKTRNKKLITQVKNIKIDRKKPQRRQIIGQSSTWLTLLQVQTKNVPEPRLLSIELTNRRPYQRGEKCQPLNFLLLVAWLSIPIQVILKEIDLVASVQHSSTNLDYCYIE